MMKNMYKELIQELSQEVEEGVLSQKDTIQILRAEDTIMDTYHPIIDWYYDEYTMKEELETPIEEMYLPEEFSKEEWDEMLKEQDEYRKQYQADQPKLLSMTVKEVLTEMKQIQKLL